MLFNSVYLFIFCLVLEYNKVIGVLITNTTFNGYRKWAPSNSSRDDMYCPNHCYNNPDEDERCCCCESVTCWQLDPTACNVTVGQLYVEYQDNNGSALFIPSGNHTLYEAFHRNGRLTKFPDNLCDFADSLVTLDLSFNKIQDISSIRCLRKLDTLRLDSNEITEVSNETFSDMEYLRIVSLSRNFIEKLDPNTNQKKNGNILMSDFSFNIVESFDVTNIIRPGAFCNISCEGCDILTQTNIFNYAMSENNIHGPGHIILRNTSTDALFNFSIVGVNDYSTLGLYFKGHFDFDDSDIACDCKIYPFLADLGADAAKYWPRLDIDNVTCRIPEQMQGRNLNNIYKTQSFENLTCDLPNCPKGCVCTDKPVDDEIKVVCKGLTSMPHFIPIGYWNNYKINLDCSDPSNDISHFSNKEYIGRLVNLNLNGNGIRSFDTQAAENLGENLYIDISGQEMKYLPVTFRKMNPNRIIFGTNPVQCNCDNLWIGDWIRHNRAQGSLKCSTSKGFVPAEDISSEFLDCLSTETIPDFVPIILVTILVLVFTVCVLSYYYRYELLLLKRKFFREKTKVDDLEYDVMFTYCEENLYVFRWIECKIVPVLKAEGYSLFIPFYDVIPGWNRFDEIAQGINKSKTYVVFLCTQYLCDEKSVQEFDLVWKHFTMGKEKRIIVVNYDNLETSEVPTRRLKAFIRIKDDINFIHRESRLIDRLKYRLGPPRRKEKYMKCNEDLKEELNEESDFNLSNNKDVFPMEKTYNVDELPCEEKQENNHVNDTVIPKHDINHGCNKLKTGPRRRRKRWYNRLLVKKKSCNCKYRKCYLESDPTGKGPSIGHSRGYKLPAIVRNPSKD